MVIPNQRETNIEIKLLNVGTSKGQNQFSLAHLSPVSKPTFSDMCGSIGGVGLVFEHAPGEGLTGVKKMGNLATFVVGWRNYEQHKVLLESWWAILCGEM